MEPQAEIVTTVAVALIAATAAGYLVALMRLPTIAGYMLAGIALPDRVTTRPAIDHARDIAPEIQMVVRAHGEEEQREILDLELGEVMVGERELAIEMARFTLRRFGVSSLELQALIQGLRSRR